MTLTLEDLDAISKRWREVPAWKWLAGSASVWVQLPEHGGHRMTFRASGNGAPHNDPWFQPVRGRWRLVGPDTQDAATSGCMLHLVREAWASRGYVSVRHPVAESLGEPWDVVVYSPLGEQIGLFQGRIEVEALLHAFEGAFVDVFVWHPGGEVSGNLADPAPEVVQVLKDVLEKP